MAVGSLTPGFLSGGTADGRHTVVVATGSPGTHIHTVGVGTDNFDLITIEAVNMHTAPVYLTVEFGGTTTSDRVKLLLAPNSGANTILRGRRLADTLQIRAFADVASVIGIYGAADKVET